MSRLEEWIIKSPYSAEDHAYMDAYTSDKKDTWRIYDTDEFTDWMIAKSQSFMKGTWLEQDLVPITRQVHPWAFGILSGPRACFETCTLHEIAHGIQLKKKDYKKRLNNFDRFHQPKSSTQIVMDRIYYEPLTMEPGLYEAEANGMQLVMLEMLGYEIDHEMFFRDWASIAQYLPDWYQGGGEKNRQMIIAKAIEVFYLVWKEQQSMMEHRFKNFCKHVGKLRKKHPEMLPQELRVVKARMV